ncbi:MAG: hypothetical protein JJ863_03295 [Deltaproteobacteria bacterium]|nr:hypothetical protein [Deltaproteobacteria bacterium]
MTTDSYQKLWTKFAYFQAALTTGLGVGCLAIPTLINGLIGLDVDASTTVLLRTFGASLLFVAILHATLAKSEERASIRGLLYANLVEDGILTLLSVAAILAGVMNGFGWLLAGAFGFEVVAAIVMLALMPKD